MTLPQSCGHTSSRSSWQANQRLMSHDDTCAIMNKWANEAVCLVTCNICVMHMYECHIYKCVYRWCHTDDSVCRLCRVGVTSVMWMVGCWVTERLGLRGSPAVSPAVFGWSVLLVRWHSSVKGPCHGPYVSGSSVFWLLASEEFKGLSH